MTGLALLLALAPACAYEVTLDPGGRELAVVAGFDGPPTGALAVDDGYDGFVKDLEQEAAGTWKPRSLRGVAPAEGRVRYRFLLGDAARASRDRHSAFEQEGAYLATPSVWLARPVSRPWGMTCRLRVATPPGLEFVTGLFRAADGDGYDVELDSIREAPYSGFGRFRTAGAEVGGSRLELAVAPGRLAVDDASLLAWLRASGRAVAGYYRRFPVPRVQVIVIPGGRRAMGYGTTLTGGGAAIMAWIGPTAGPKDLDDDWVLVHEMIHLGFPTVRREQHWLEEGLATYAEPIARVGAGTMTLDAAWKSMLEGLPRGLRAGAGLDGARSIDSLYWGGALYWFLADLQIRQRTGNALGLRDALCGILEAGGNATREWEAGDVLTRGDAVVGGRVLVDLYDSMASRPARVDLASTFDRLGVSLKGGSVAYDDSRPLAPIRSCLVAAPAKKP
jgi:hypothetical protein